MKHIAFLFDKSSRFSPEEHSAWDFLSRLKSVRSTRISFQSLTRQSNSHQLPHLLWWHFDSSKEIPKDTLYPEVVSRLRDHVQKGGSLFLSLIAAQYVVDLGFEELRPNIIKKAVWDEDSWTSDYPDVRGIATYLGHPIFRELPGGVYTWNPRKGDNYCAAMYEGVTPASAKIVGVERQYIKLNEHRRIVSELQFGKGRILTVGTYLFFRDQRHRFRHHLEQFASNCFAYLSQASPDSKETRTYWNFDTRDVTEIERTSNPLNPQLTAIHVSDSGQFIKRDLSSDDRSDHYFDVGGRRILIAGKERDGISEIWCHPLRIARDLKIAFKVGKSAVRWARDLKIQFTARPECIARTYSFEGAIIKEVVFGDRERPGGAIHFHADSKESVEIFVTASVDLRLMWPLSDEATGSLTYVWDDKLHAAVVAAPHPQLAALIGSSTSPEEHLVGQFSSFEISNDRFVGKPTGEIVVGLAMRYRLSASENEIALCFSGSHLGEREAEGTYRTITEDPAATLNRQTTHYKKLLGKSTQIKTPNPEFNEAYRWALTSTDQFFAEVPGIGSSLFAGYGTTDQGWHGGHSISGRPGYAWFFGRDSVWTSFAVLGYGDFEKVKSVLDFLGRHQDASGKIAHELTTSGFAHYDAADSTPLYIILMGKYLKASGDTAFVRKHFDRLVGAIEFCHSTDTDGDHLIENTNVGHGWVEGGQLFPVHTEHYLASCWTKALEVAAFVASTLHKEKLSKRWKKESGKVAQIVRNRFWNERTQFYNFGKLANGTFNEQKTLLPAVGISFGYGKKEQARKCLEEYASEKFSTDWGTRIVGNDNPMYKPTGYHYGSVWPLFTGWASLAEFKEGRPIQGFLHAMNNLLLYNRFAAGCIEEVLDGERFQPAGVCPHQAWSESMAIQPILEGMLGLDIDALDARVSFRPYFPPDWNSAIVKNIPVGHRRLIFTMNREAGTTDFEFKIQAGKPLTVSFQPYLSLGTQILRMEINHLRTSLRKRKIFHYRDCPKVVFRLSKSTEYSIRALWRRSCCSSGASPRTDAGVSRPAHH